VRILTPEVVEYPRVGPPVMVTVLIVPYPVSVHFGPLSREQALPIPRINKNAKIHLRDG